jgi:hypothetical protein
MANGFNKQPAYAGEANFDEWGTHPDYSNMGGGMSASENRMVNHVGRNIASSGGPKRTDGGKNLGPKATNTTSVPGCDPPEASPSATNQSRNQGEGTDTYD